MSDKLCIKVDNKMTRVFHTCLVQSIVLVPM
jgi:hypothetical protein